MWYNFPQDWSFHLQLLLTLTLICTIEPDWPKMNMVKQDVSYSSSSKVLGSEQEHILLHLILD